MTAVPKPTPSVKVLKRLQTRQRPVNADAARTTFARDGYQCQWCKGIGGTVIPHHRLRRSAGGRDVPAHMVSVHQTCHSYIHDHPAEAYERGFLVHSEDELIRGWT